MPATITMDANTILILSNLALATGIIYLLLVHHRETHKKGNKR